MLYGDSFESLFYLIKCKNLLTFRGLIFDDILSSPILNSYKLKNLSSFYEEDFSRKLFYYKNYSNEFISLISNLL